MKPRPANRLLYALTVIWMLLTVSLATWWMVFGLEQARQLRALGGAEGARLERVQQMLVWEGVTFIALLLVGGGALAISVWREQTRQRAVESFFLSFTHDLKTALTSLQLQAESLAEDLEGAADNPNLQRLMKDALRLRVQLENSLYFAQPDGDMLAERVDLAQCVERTAQDWPELAVQVDGDAVAFADRRAIETVLRNLLQNAVVHGSAHHVTVQVARNGTGRIHVTATDDGCGPAKEVRRKLGRPFTRSHPSTGTGVGLYVSQQLARRMRGDLRFGGTSGPGFTVVLDLPSAE